MASKNTSAQVTHSLNRDLWLGDLWRDLVVEEVVDKAGDVGTKSTGKHWLRRCASYNEIRCMDPIREARSAWHSLEDCRWNKLEQLLRCKQPDCAEDSRELHEGSSFSKLCARLHLLWPHCLQPEELTRYLGELWCRFCLDPEFWCLKHDFEGCKWACPELLLKLRKLLPASCMLKGIFSLLLCMEKSKSTIFSRPVRLPHNLEASAIGTEASQRLPPGDIDCRRGVGVEQTDDGAL